MITAFFYTLNPRCDLGLDVKDQISLLHHILLIVKTKGLQGIVVRNTIVLLKKKKRYVVPLILKLALQYAYAQLAVKCRKSSIYCHIWISQIHYYKFDISFFFFLVIIPEVAFLHSDQISPQDHALTLTIKKLLNRSMMLLHLTLVDRFINFLII